MKLTTKQAARLRVIGDLVLKGVTIRGTHPWWGNSTDRSLLRRGLIERCDETRQLAPSVSFTTHLCRITDAGRAALSARSP